MMIFKTLICTRDTFYFSLMSDFVYFYSGLKEWEYWYKDCWAEFDWEAYFLTKLYNLQAELNKQESCFTLEIRRHRIKERIKTLEKELLMLEDEAEMTPTEREQHAKSLAELDVLIHFHDEQSRLVSNQHHEKLNALWETKQEINQYADAMERRLQEHEGKMLTRYEKEGGAVMLKIFDESNQILQQRLGNKMAFVKFNGVCGCGKVMKDPTNASHRNSAQHKAKLKKVCVYIASVNSILRLLMKVIPIKGGFAEDCIIPFLFQPLCWNQ